MTGLLKAELRKIYTIRSTYIILLIAVIIMCIFAFWVEGYKAGTNSVAATDPHKLAKLLSDAITSTAALGALVGLLLATHEYRYNTITYTLTASRSRSQTLLAKFLAVTIFSVIFTLFVSVMAPALMYLGMAVHGISMSHQVVPMDLIWRILFVGWGYAAIALLLGMVIRQQVGAVVVFLFLPGPIEGLAGLLLKDNIIYLPFTALQQVTGLMGASGIKHVLSPGKAALVFAAYLVVGWIITWYLFLRRDAN